MYYFQSVERHDFQKGNHDCRILRILVNVISKLVNVIGNISKCLLVMNRCTLTIGLCQKMASDLFVIPIACLPRSQK